MQWEEKVAIPKSSCCRLCDRLNHPCSLVLRHCSGHSASESRLREGKVSALRLKSEKGSQILFSVCLNPICEPGACALLLWMGCADVFITQGRKFEVSTHGNLHEGNPPKSWKVMDSPNHLLFLKEKTAVRRKSWCLGDGKWQAETALL